MIQVLCAVLSWLMMAGSSLAQPVTGSASPPAFPTKPIRFVVPYAAGGGTDAMARFLARGMEQRLGFPVVIENRGGSGTTLGASYVAKAPADGYTLLMATSSTLAIAPHLYKNLSYDPTADFSPLSMIASVPFVLIVHPSLGVDSVAGLIALARKRQADTSLGALSYASGGSGSAHHIFMELFKSMAGVDMKHVPYRGGGPAQIDVIAGHVPVMFGDVGPASEQIRSGQLKGLAVTTTKRVEILAALPTLEEAGLAGYEANSWQCVVGPPGLPEPIVARLNSVLVDIMATQESQRHFIGIGAIPTSSTPAATGAFIKSEVARWAKVIDGIGTINQ